MTKRTKIRTLGLLKTVSHWQEILDPSTSLMTVRALLEVAGAEERGEELDIKTLGHRLGVASSSATRQASLLREWTWTHKPGKGLITARRDPLDSRRWTLELTRKGREVVAQLEDALS